MTMDSSKNRPERGAGKVPGAQKSADISQVGEASSTAQHGHRAAQRVFGGTLPVWIAWRHLRSKRSERFISLITWLSAGGVMVGVAALIVVFAVMTGYTRTLRDKLVGVNAHATVYSYQREPVPLGRVRTLVERVEGVADVTEVLTGQAMAATAKGSAGAVVRGVEADNDHWRRFMGDIVQTGSLAPIDTGGPALYVGNELARTLGAGVGDPVRLTIPVGAVPKLGVFRVAGIFSTGMYDFDSTVAVMSLAHARKLFELDASEGQLEVRFTDVARSRAGAEAVARALGPGFWVPDWEQQNRNMFYALKLQRTVLALILSLIILVAAFNVAATLIMIVLEKTQEIGILKAMGASNRTIGAIFAAQGIIVGAGGAGAGFLLGFSVCALLERYPLIKIPSDIYLFDRLPIAFSLLPSAGFALTAVFLCWVATLYPCYKASRLDPVEAIRAE